ncbi:MAG TPA: response regulator [Longimicrobiales bacterium]|nr:response regulator [Longimicrobiales bacterium]
MAHAKVSNVLVVEDEPRVRRLVSKALRRSGFVVLEAEDGEAALRLFGVHAPDIALLLTDVVMPGMNGPELAASLSRSHPGLKVIFISGSGDAERSARRSAAAGAAHISKPFTPAALAGIVEGVLGT